MKNKKIFLKIIVPILLLNINVSVFAMALTAPGPIEINGDIYSFGSNSPCGGINGYEACYEPKFEFRVTLVDRTGKKVEDTNSVDYGYEPDSNKNDIIHLTKKVSTPNKNNFINTEKYGYKYSTLHDDYNPMTEYQYYTIDMLPYQCEINCWNYHPLWDYISLTTYKDDPVKYKNFANKFIEDIMSQNKHYGIDSGTNGMYSFITMFLYHSGYLKKTATGNEYHDINESINSEARRKIAENDYYLLIEPLYTIYHNNEPYKASIRKYGTATEISNYLYNLAKDNKTKVSNGYLVGLTLTFTYNIGTNLYVQPEKYEDFRTLKSIQFDGVNGINSYNINTAITSPKSPLDVRYNRIAKWNEIGSVDYGYGMNLLRLSSTVSVPDPIQKNYQYNYTLTKCDNTNTTKNNTNGIVSFSIPKELKNITIISNEDNYFETNKIEGNRVSCIDDFIYDFSNTLVSLNKSFFYTTVVNINGKATINRYCYVENNENYDGQVNEFVEDFDMYQKNIPITLFGTTIEMSPIETENKNILREIVKKTGKKEIIKLTYVQNFAYKNSKFVVTPNIEPNKDYESNIDLSNVSYGYSTKLINKLKTDGKINYTTVSSNSTPTNYTFTLDEKGESVCKFNTSVKTGGGTPTSTGTGGHNPGGTTTTPTPDPIDDQLKFRVISLENPFPARDASSRMPGTNWIGKTNYIREYITNNRGVTEEEVYNKEPIYVINLTPSTMIKIREYNKKHNYSDIVLNCSEDTKTECTSEFLRNEEYFEKNNDISGTCMIDYTPTDITNGITEKMLHDKLATTSDFTYDASAYESKYDFNKDQRLNKIDASIFMEADKTTTFYTCADKTYESSGYLGRGEE